MSDADRSQPDPELAALLAALPQSIPAPGALEPRVINATRTTRLRPRALAASAALLLFALGIVAGRLLPVAARPDPDSGRYLLLLYEDAEYRPAEPGGTSKRVDEYRAWARDLSARGVTVRGERLDDDGVELQPSGRTVESASDRADRIGGFFIISTSDRTEAERIAKTCPHLRYGGRIVVKAILPT